MTIELNIGLVLPDVLGTYGDDGNALVLRQRARMRGWRAEFHPINLGEAIPEKHGPLHRWWRRGHCADFGG